MHGCIKVTQWPAAVTQPEINLIFDVSENESVFQSILSNLKIKLSNREIRNIRDHVKKILCSVIEFKASNFV